MSETTQKSLQSLETLQRECREAFEELWWHRDWWFGGHTLSQYVAHAKEEDRLREKAMALRKAVEEAKLLYRVETGVAETIY